MYRYFYEIIFLDAYQQVKSYLLYDIVNYKWFTQPIYVMSHCLKQKKIMKPYHYPADTSDTFLEPINTLHVSSTLHSALEQYSPF